jgi:uncharacterized DUF497 family protein
MDIEFDPIKDALNIEKHGISLTRVLELETIVVVQDERFEERRVRLYGMLDGLPHCAAATLRAGVLRVISLRRAHAKEYRRHVR